MLKKIMMLHLLLLLMVSQTVFAEATIQSLGTDDRAKIVGFNPNQIYTVKTHYLVSTDIILGEDEVIEDVNLGDASSWDIQSTRNHCYVKAKKIDAAGNLTLTTNKYSYHFVLSVADAAIDSKEQTLFLKFTYPTHGEDEKKMALELITLPPDLCQSPVKYNRQYSFTGDADQAPLLACDDGIFTYLKFRKHRELPAIFVVLPDRKEEVVNYRMQGGYLIVERVGKAFTLRNGDITTMVYNDKVIGDWKTVIKKGR